MPRETVSSARLYAVLDREFRKARPRGCRTCRAPLPYWREPPDEVSANWDIGTPAKCSFGCDRIIVELAARLWTQYDLQRPEVEGTH